MTRPLVSCRTLASRMARWRAVCAAASSMRKYGVCDEPFYALRDIGRALSSRIGNQGGNRTESTPASLQATGLVGLACRLHHIAYGTVTIVTTRT
jgi:hypothetical protein